MKIGSTTENTLITNIEGDGKSKFKIAATGKAFQILSSSLYSYKTKAVVREIGCNAYDAHIDAGTTDRPFDVSLPCKEDPHFKVRDYGIGLAEDKFVEIYTTYFGSSKADSNDHTGGLGLGSKTPFIMSKAFTVHSFYNGTEYMWHSYVNDNGEPDVVLLNKKATTEPNGLLVVVPIGQGMGETEKNALFREFRTEAEDIYRWFEVVPNVTCNKIPISIKKRLSANGVDMIALTGGSGITVYYNNEGAKETQTNTILVKMGNVAYPYDLNKVQSLERFGGNIQLTNGVLEYIKETGRVNPGRQPLVIDVPMGAVDIAPSREALSLVNTTEVTIINALVRFVDMLMDRVQETIDKAKTTYEKYQALYTVPACGARKFIIAGKEIEPRTQMPTWLFGTAQEIAARKATALRTFTLGADLVVKYRRSGTRGIMPMKTTFSMEMYGAGVKGRHIVLVDQAYKGELRGWINANCGDCSAVVVVFGYDRVKDTQRPLTAAEMKDFMEDGHPQVVKFSEFKNKPAIATRSTNAPSTARKIDSETAIQFRYTSTSGSWFTAGNSHVAKLEDIFRENTPTKAGQQVRPIIALVKTKDEIKAEVSSNNPKDPDETSMITVGQWSRAQGTTSNMPSRFTGDFYVLFRTVANRVNTSKTLETVIDGKKTSWNVDSFMWIALTQEVYDEIVDNPDYPQLFSLHRAIEDILSPALPTQTEVTTVNHNDGPLVPCSSYNRGLTEGLECISGLGKLTKWAEQLRQDSLDPTSSIISTFNGSTIVKEYGYSVTSTTAQHRKYVFSVQNWKAVLKAIQADGGDVGVAAEKLQMLMFDVHNNNYSCKNMADLFSSSGYYTENFRKHTGALYRMFMPDDAINKQLASAIMDQFDQMSTK